MTAPNSESGSLKQQIGNGNPDGIVLGQVAADPVGFYGTTPKAQQATTAGAGVTTTVSISTTTTKWGFATSTQANEIITMVNDLRTALVNIGILSA
jgi:UDP-N-acetyl-D-mannosaminuronic acid transferase (WecB/TagA/CpsF family)